MIKIPATPEGIPAIEAAIAAGINVNVTLIFAINNYEQVAEAFIRGLEQRLARRGRMSARVASVASFFLSRIDVMVDAILENNIRAAQLRQDTARISANSQLLGQTAIANAKMAYRSFQRIFEGERFEQLRSAGAQVQRPLWASTGTKNPAYPDTLYVDNLIGAHTVNTLPPATLAAFKDHGAVAETLTRDMPGFLPPDEALDKLAELGVDLSQVTARLQDDGVDAFIEAFETLISQVAAKRTLLRSGIIERTKLALGIYNGAVDEAVAALDEQQANRAHLEQRTAACGRATRRLSTKSSKRLGWLDVAETIDRARAGGAARQRSRRRLAACRAAGHGRQFPRARGAGEYSRGAARLPAANRAGQHRPRSHPPG